MRKRSIVSIILLSFVTCGIYTLILYYQMFSDINRECRENDTAGTDLLLMIITCGIWGIYCMYKYSKKLARLGCDDNSVINILLSIFSLQLIALCIMQDSINRYVDEQF